MTSLPLGNFETHQIQDLERVLKDGLHPRSWPKALAQSYYESEREKHLPEFRFLLLLTLATTYITSAIDVAQSIDFAIIGLELRTLYVLPILILGLVFSYFNLRRACVFAQCAGNLAFSLVVLHLSFMLPSIDAARYTMGIALMMGIANMLYPLRLGTLIAFNFVFLLAFTSWLFFVEKIDLAANIHQFQIIAAVILGSLALKERIARLEARNFLLRLRHKYDADEQRHINLMLSELSNRDPLTGIANRRHFEVEFARLMHSQRGKRDFHALLVIDIDHFKRINDDYGHLAGDQCLRIAAQTMRTIVETHGGMVARFGGEEFIALIPQTHEDQAHRIAETLCFAMANLTVEHEGSKIRLTASVGGIVTPSNSQCKPTTLIRDADAALYAAKEQGRNRVVMVANCA